MLIKTTLNLMGLMLFFVASQSWSKELSVAADRITVEDGDTLLISFDDGVKRVQLIDIDAPEDTDNAKFKVDMKRTGLDYDTLYSLGAIATKHLRKLLAEDDGFKLVYEPDRLDRYGRLLGDLRDEEGVSISEKMVMNGYAIAKPSGKLNTPHPYVALQRRAQLEKRGLWGLLPKQTRLWSGSAPTQ
ncbi:MAG: thermonuclease family protein [Candidatus Thiodiazotropha sp. (ex Monitilora ramsayi)]|nr:thermonuclease family protein [Candidatus Thiodiazotropha sp. (ex Monitilora ramsayi)]